MIQVHAGWLSAPAPLTDDGRFADNPFDGCSIAVWFLRATGRKLRGRDDFRASLTKTACAIRSRIMLPGCGYIASTVRILIPTGFSLPSGKVDRNAAYNALPVG